MPIIQPIFVIGSGRSGTTILYHLLTIHKDTYWFSLFTEKYINFPKASVVHGLYDLPIIGKHFKHQLLKYPLSINLLTPGEGEQIYRKFGFQDNCRMTEKNLNLIKAKEFKKFVLTHQVWTQKTRFLAKRTANTQRLRLINLLFPDAIYIHLIRDGQAVADSLCRQSWWPRLNLWWLGQRPIDWQKQNPLKDPLELCALHWQKNIQEILSVKKLLSNRYFELRYEDLIKNVPQNMKKVLDFCQLSWSRDYEQLLPKTLPNMNSAWRKNVSMHKQIIIREAIRPLLCQLNYLKQ